MQLDLFKNWENKANELVELLNMDRKKDLYELSEIMIINDSVIISAKNKQNKIFNILTIAGEIKSDMSANWRSGSHIISDLKEILK